MIQYSFQIKLRALSVIQIINVYLRRHPLAAVSEFSWSEIVLSGLMYPQTVVENGVLGLLREEFFLKSLRKRIHD